MIGIDYEEEGEGAFAAADTAIICAGKKEEDNEGLIVHFITSITYSGCIACPLPEKKD